MDIGEVVEMKPYIKYFWYIVRHKWFVFVAGLKTKAPIWLLLIHDWSKLLPDEFIPYANYFNNQKLQEKENIEAFKFGLAELAPFGYFAKDRFNVAWLYHQRRNPHHWQYWYLMQDNDPDFPLPMPEKYAREMLADWMGAGRAITGKWDVKTWYEKNKEVIKIHPDTRVFVETLMELV